MDKIKFIEEAIANDLEYWENVEKQEPNNAFYRGTVASLRALKNKIEFVFKENKEIDNKKSQGGIK